MFKDLTLPFVLELAGKSKGINMICCHIDFHDG